MLKINAAFGKEAVVKALDLLKQKIYKIEPNQLCEGSKAYEFNPNNDFYVFYNLFVTEFLNTVKSISELPAETFKEAVNNLLSEKEFIFDFYNPSNLFIDWENKSFNFIDFVFEEKRVKKNNMKDQIIGFRNALYGTCVSTLIQSEDLLFYKKDNELFDSYAKIITDKINNFVPKELKITNIRYHFLQYLSSVFYKKFKKLVKRFI